MSLSCEISPEEKSLNTGIVWATVMKIIARNDFNFIFNSFRRKKKSAKQSRGKQKEKRRVKKSFNSNQQTQTRACVSKI